MQHSNFLYIHDYAVTKFLRL